MSWHHEGKLFMSCHGDGSLSVWNARSPIAPEKSWMPHVKETDGGFVNGCDCDHL